MSFENGLFIFRRDFRTIDNSALNNANSKCKRIFTIFVFTPEQVTKANKFKSDNAVQFMIESLEDLAKDISQSGGHLYTFFGENDKIIAQCIKAWNINYVSFNADYTPYALKRDTEIESLCVKLGVKMETTHDYYLHPPGTIMNGTGEPYKKFTPYYNAAQRQHIQSPAGKRRIHFAKSGAHLSNTISLDSAFSRFTKENKSILVHGGRPDALQCLKQALKTQKHYSKTHNDLEKPTTQLSAYIKFGCLSIREVWKAFRSNKDLVRQLIWRDFYANILFSFPYVLGNAMKPSYDKIRWHKNTKWLNAWKMGTTGFPIVDAGMRQLAETGYMHNRARLITSSFLIKVLLIDWQEGEKYFAQHLTDYDPASNNGNWQWGASTGADSQPYFRIFNPWLQSEEYDPDAEYIKQWIPELREVDSKVIHQWYKYSGEKEFKDIKYPAPLVDYSKQKEIVLKMYSSVFK